MQNLSCPIPANLNPLQANGFKFAITKLPEVSFFCQEANIPGLDLPSADLPTTLVNAPLPGEKMSFGDLNITFMIDEQMANYVAVYNWIVGMSKPISSDQYTSFLAKDNLNRMDLYKEVSDGVLQILNNSGSSIRQIMFKDLWPTSLSSLQMQSTVDDTIYLVGNATFKYTLYDIV